MFFKKILFLIYLTLLRLFLKKEEIIDNLETVLVKSFIENVEFDMIKDFSEKELEAFTLYFCLFFTEPYSYCGELREEVVNLSFKKCLRRAKWETSLLQ